MKKKPIAVDLNPKAVTNNELFGIINPATREWKDGDAYSYFNFKINFNTHQRSKSSYLNSYHSGLFSYVMRDMANNSSDSLKWIVLDGDIDPMWIESLNTVMDDNKVILTNSVSI